MKSFGRIHQKTQAYIHVFFPNTRDKKDLRRNPKQLPTA